MLMIRLQRIGKKGQAYFRVVLAEHTKKAKGEFQELLGTYNPHQKQFKVERERVEFWMAKGAQVSPTVNNLMVNYKVWDRPKVQSWKPKKNKKAKAEGEKVTVPAVPAETPATPSEAPAEVVAEAPAETVEATPAQ